MSDTARYGHYYFLSRQTAAIDGSANCFPGVSTIAYFMGAPLCAGGSVRGHVPVTANNLFFPVLGTPVSSVDVLRDRPSGSGTIETAMNDLDFNWISTAGFASGPLSTRSCSASNKGTFAANTTGVMNLIAGHTHCEALLGLHRSLSREVDALTPAKQL